MVKCKYITPKHRAYAATARVNKLVLPRALFMAAKYRARRALPTHSAAWNGLKNRSCRQTDGGLYSFSLERPPIPDIDPERVAYTQPQFKGLPPAHIRGHVGVHELLMGLYDRIFVDPPKTRLPSWYNVVIKDLGLAA
ncbi:hypothetical protein GSI_09002 [Ganoderma sinense ZZ0214-1]|uniref:Uncharacterized protein n=1 Tax=Ganoderma sinense ZZ0214-1 TaxID=1077348 RepID=A0A2G8S5C9_9APHY|nr:hypothetical protein GSI_09002 [Ganoderma sinense ZZ0214-1]